MEALVASGLVEDRVRRNWAALHWSEASRTDKGVHCCAQVLSLHCHFPPRTRLRDLVALISAHLPRDSTVRIWAAITLGLRFNAQRSAESRRYGYLLPLSILAPGSLAALAREVLPLFVGSHKFHNFTRKVSALSPSAKRTVFAFSVSDPLPIKKRQYVLFTIRGNSFLFNQIRIMMALVVLISVGRFDVADVPKAFADDAIDLPVFPGEGLFLDQVEYTGFMRVSNETGIFTGVAKDVEFTAYRPQIDEWRNQVLFSHIADLVTRERTFERWLECPTTNIGKRGEP
jgi:tRNA pseudouridine38-40 synthase